MDRFYDIPGTVNVNDDPYFTDPALCPDFIDRYEQFKRTLIKEVADKDPVSYLRFGDGDYFFLTKQAIGSATPGRRAFSLPYDRIDISAHLSGVIKNDHISAELSRLPRGRFNELFPGYTPDVPMEFIYGSVANKWFFEQFKGRVGLIGASEKIRIIQKLMEYPTYQEYVGVDRFEDYVTIPQKFAADNVEKIEKLVSDQLSSAHSRIFLLGIGHVKCALVHRLRQHYNAVYVDVGGGIDMIAGIIDYERPYAAGWVNHRLRDYDYSTVDLMCFKPQSTDRWLP